MIDVNEFEFDCYSLAELQEIQTHITTVIESKQIEARREAVSKMREIAREAGLSVEDVLKGAATKGGNGKASAAAKYRNPENSTQTWTGRGKRPRWIKDAIDAGRPLEEFRA